MAIDQTCEPSFDHDDVAEEDLVFEGCPEGSLRGRQALLDLTTDTRHRPDGCTFEFGHLKAEMLLEVSHDNIFIVLWIILCYLYTYIALWST